MKINKELTQSRLKELLDYDPSTGMFTWKVYRSRFARPGDCAGSPDKNGYVCIGIDGSVYKAHRLAWLYINGSFPSKGLDHINRVKNDNKIDNLREATDSENKQNIGVPANNKSGIVGVRFDKACKKWSAYIKINGIMIFLGLHSSMSDAIFARKLAKSKYHKFNPEDAS